MELIKKLRNFFSTDVLLLLKLNGIEKQRLVSYDFLEETLSNNSVNTH